MTEGTPLFTTFNFHVRILVGGNADPLCNAAFAECGGLEMSMQAKTIREGGNNVAPIHLTGQLAYGTLALKRGMTRNLDLWDWMERAARDDGRSLRATCEVDMLAADRSGPDVTFVLTGCLPTKLKAPALNAQNGLVAIEEMEIAYQTLALRRGGG
jgi:phage tail-like protein